MHTYMLPFGEIQIPDSREVVEFAIKPKHNEPGQSYTLSARKLVIINALRERLGSSLRIVMSIHGGDVYDPNGNHVFTFGMDPELDREVWDYTRQQVRPGTYTIQGKECWREIFCTCDNYPRAV